MKSKLKIIERKLGRERACGQFTSGDNLVEIDPRLKPRMYLNTLCHELTHYLFPEASESKVETTGRILAHHIWAAGYRRIVK